MMSTHSRFISSRSDGWFEPLRYAGGIIYLAPSNSCRHWMNDRCAAQNARAASNAGNVFANLLAELPSNESTPNRPHMRILIALLTRPTWQYEPHSRARSAQRPIVSNFQSVEPPTKTPTLALRIGRTSAAIIPSCTGTRRRDAIPSSRGSHDSESLRLSRPPATMSGATMKSAPAPRSATMRSNASRSHGVPRLNAVHAPLSIAYGNPSVRWTPVADTIKRQPAPRRTSRLRRVPVREAYEITSAPSASSSCTDCITCRYRCATVR